MLKVKRIKLKIQQHLTTNLICNIEAMKTSPQTPNDINTQLLSFLNEFKLLINSLISLLIKLISSLLNLK